MSIWKRFVLLILSAMMMVSGITLLQPDTTLVYALDTANDVMTFEQAAKTLREAMTKRTDKVSIKVDLGKKLTQQSLTAYNMLLFDAVLAETGIADEGDYLRWNLGHYQVNAKGNGTVYTLTYSLKYHTTKAQEDAIEKKIKNVLDSFEFTKKTTDREKVYTIYKFVTKNAKYDYTSQGILKHTAYANLIEKTSVCQGYANLMYRMLTAVGIENRIITGESYNQKSKQFSLHAWNIVNLDGLYYNIDATWDSQYVHKGLEYEYFLKSDDSFKNHIRDAKYATDAFYKQYPMADKDKGEIPSTKNIKNGCKVILSSTKYTFNGKNHKPSVKLINGDTVISNKYYTVSYKNNKKPGTATVTIKAKNGYTGTLTTKFIIEKQAGPKLKGLSVDKGKITIAWNKVNGASSYNVYRSDNGGTLKLLDTTNSTSYVDSKVKSGTTYSYSVTAVMNEIETKKTSTTYTYLATPSKITASSITRGIKVTWGKVSGATGYEVSYKTGKTEKVKTVKKASTVSYSIKKLTKNKTYTVKVRAYKTVNGVNSYSDWTPCKNVKVNK